MYAAAYFIMMFCVKTIHPIGALYSQKMVCVFFHIKTERMQVIATYFSHLYETIIGEYPVPCCNDYSFGIES